SDEALTLLNKIIAFDNANILALRARAELYLRSGRAVDAQWDCQKLIAANPSNAPDRVRLVRAYQKQGNMELADATIWNALNDVPEDKDLYPVAKAYFLGRNQPTSAARVDQLAKDQHALEQSRW